MGTVHSLYKLTAILFGIGVTLHNLEEAVYLPAWLRSHVKLFFTPSEKIYWVLTSLVSVVVWVPIVGVFVSPGESCFESVLSGFALVMVVNAVVPHLAWSLLKRSYSPGTATAVLFNLPLGVLLMRGQLAVAASRAFVWRDAFLYALLFAGGTLGCLYGAHAIAAARHGATGRV